MYLCKKSTTSRYRWWNEKRSLLFALDIIAALPLLALEDYSDESNKLFKVSSCLVKSSIRAKILAFSSFMAVCIVCNSLEEFKYAE